MRTLQPGYQQDSGSDGEGSYRRDLRPAEPTTEVAQQCTAAAALAWLHTLAIDPHMETAEVRLLTVCFETPEGSGST